MASLRRAALPHPPPSFAARRLLAALVLLPLLAFAPSGQARSQQTLALRSSEKVIDTREPNVKWRISEGAFVELSTNAGATWEGQEVAARGSLLDGSAPAAKTCWLVGRGGLVFLTRNAGSKKGTAWKKLSPPVPADLVSVSAKNGSSAVVTAADGRQFSTDDAGKDWKEVPNPANPSSNRH